MSWMILFLKSVSKNTYKIFNAISFFCFVCMFMKTENKKLTTNKISRLLTKNGFERYTSVSMSQKGFLLSKDSEGTPVLSYFSGRYGNAQQTEEALNKIASLLTEAGIDFGWSYCKTKIINLRYKEAK